MPIITFLAANFVPKMIPEPLRKAAVWATLILSVTALLWAAQILYDRSIVREHEQKRAAKSIEAREKASEERAADTLRDAANEKGRNDAINAAPTGGALSPAELSLNCRRLHDLGREPAACRHTGGD